MMRGMFAAISGLKTHQVMLDVTANDIANVNTIGYKSARTTFTDSLTQLQRGASGAGGGTGGSNAAQIGLGIQLGSIDNLMSSGALQSTGNPLDVAIQGAGMFRVAPSTATPPTANPTAVEYTRAGNFTTNSAGYLVTQDGYYVQGRTAGGADTLLQIPPELDQHAIAQNGDVTYVDGDGHTRDRGLRSRWPRSPTRPASSAPAPTAGSRAPTRARRPSAPRAPRSASRPPARSRCPTWTSPRRSRA